MQGLWAPRWPCGARGAILGGPPVGNRNAARLLRSRKEARDKWKMRVKSKKNTSKINKMFFIQNHGPGC